MIAELYKRAPIGIVATLVNASILVIVLWKLVSHSALILWLIVTLLAALSRFIHVIRFHRISPEIDQSGSWGRRFIANAGLSGLLWGSAGVFLIPVESTAHQAFIAFVLAGMVAGAVGTFSSVMPAFLAFSLPALCPIFFRFISFGDDIHLAMSAMTLLFMMLTFFTARHINLSSRELVEIKEQFSDQVAERTAQLRTSNEELIQEIEERKRIEGALERSKADWENTFNSISDWISILAPDFRILRTNRAGEKLLGLPLEKIVGRKCFNLVHCTEEPFPGCPVHEMVRSRKMGSTELQLPDGRWLMVAVDPMIDEKGDLSGVVHSVRDITEHKRTGAIGKESEERFRTITQTSKDAIFCQDKNNRYTFVNPSMERLLKKPASQILGKTVLDFIPSEATSTFQEANRRTLAGETLQEVLTLKIGDKERVYNLIQVPLRDSGGKIVGISGSARDITKTRRLERELQQAHKMEAIATLAGGIAHQFNNALAVITVNLDLLELDSADDPETNNKIRSMRDAAFKMSGLNGQLLAYARGGKYQVKIMSFGDFVKNTLLLLRHRIGPAIRLETHLRENVSRVNIDTAQMQMVLSAILENSIEATEGKGEIRISTFNKKIDEIFAKKHPGLKPGLYACLQIEDNGRGMDESTKRHLFEPFFTTKFQGRGLGMAAVYGIVKNHDGYVSVDSESGIGTAVCVYIPAVEAKDVAPQKPGL